MKPWPIFCARCPSPAVWRVETDLRAAVCCDAHLPAVMRWATMPGRPPPVPEALFPDEPSTLF